MLLSCAWVSTAQEKKTKDKAKARPDLSGTWTLDKEKSRPQTAGLYLFRKKFDPNSVPDITLVISQHDVEIKIARRTKTKDEEQSQEIVYHPDGREEMIPLIIWNGREVKAKSRASWSGNTLVARHLVRESLDEYDAGFEVIFEWKLSKDGKTLSQITRIISEDMTVTRGQPFPSIRGNLASNAPWVSKKVFKRVEN